MDYVIAVEDSLNNVTQELEEKRDYSLVSLEDADLDQVDAVVLTGSDENVMGMMDTITEAPVVNAEGLDANEVEEAIKNKILKNE